MKNIFFILIFSTQLTYAASGGQLKPVQIDLGNKASLQRGAQIFFNNCAANSNWL